ncbi:MAG: DUF998 domain-containing protein [Desulfurococcales archaeon]|nr:DUF998 domain-containing protein [Desulfurococcales archaeon]
MGRLELRDRACFLGLATIVSGLLTIGAAMLANPWFDVWEGALSDMGKVNLPTAWIFNAGLIITSLVGAGFTYCLVQTFRDTYMLVAAGIYLTSMAHLALIGLFPEGTAPHWTLSYEYFLMMYVTFFVYGFGFFLIGLRGHGVAAFSIGVLGLLLSAIISWPSTAVLELFNVAVIGGWYLVVTHAVSRSDFLREKP